MSRRLSFEDACARYQHRFTMDHKPRWARVPMNNGRHYAPQYRSDREWYENTRFPGEEGWIGRGQDCYTTGQTWPLGQSLAVPFEVNQREAA